MFMETGKVYYDAGAVYEVAMDVLMFKTWVSFKRHKSKLFDMVKYD